MSRSVERGKPKVSEAEIQRSILGYLKLKGIFAWRQNSGSFRMENNGKSRFVRAGFTGISDIIGIMPDGTFLAIEVKRPGNVATLDQRAFLDAVRANCGDAFVATSIEDVRRELGI
jgi:ribosomal protein L32E